MATGPSPTSEQPVTDDDGAEEFVNSRILNVDKDWIPCPWSVLRRVSTHEQVCDLATTTLFLMQEMSVVHYGAKFPDFLDDLGYQRIGWNVHVGTRSLPLLKLHVHSTASICFRFIHMFNLLRLRYTRSVAVNLLDGFVTQHNGIVHLMHNFVHFLSNNICNPAALNACAEHCSSLLACSEQFSLDKDVKVTKNEASDETRLELDDLTIERSGRAISMNRSPLAMLKLATMGFVWNTDAETESLLKAAAPSGCTPRTIGVWRPLNREERDSLTDAVDVNGLFRITGTTTWVRRIWYNHSFMRRQASFHVQDGITREMAVGYVPMPTCELNEINKEFLTAYWWYANHRESWARELHECLSELKSRGLNPYHQEFGKAIQLRREAAEDRFGKCGGFFEMLFGPVNTIFSYACEPTSWAGFAELHIKRCLRVIGVTTLIDGTPLYKWKPRQNDDDESCAMLAKETWVYEPILSARRGRLSPAISKCWDTSEIW